MSTDIPGIEPNQSRLQKQMCTLTIYYIVYSGYPYMYACIHIDLTHSFYLYQ